MEIEQTILNSDNETLAADTVTRFKKPIVILAIIALVLTAFSCIVTYLSYQRYNLNSIILFLRLILIPMVIAGLFVVFCSLIGKKSIALTGIPSILSIAFSCFSVIQSITVLAQHDFLSYLQLVKPILFNLTFPIAFVIIYMLAVTRTFRSEKAGKVLTIVFASIIAVISLLSFVSRTIQAIWAVRALSFDSDIKNEYILAALDSAIGFPLCMVEKAALILCVFSVSEPNEISSEK